MCKYGSWLYVYEIHSFIHVYVHKCIYASTRAGAGYVYITRGNKNNYSSGESSYSNDTNGKIILIAIVLVLRITVLTAVSFSFYVKLRVFQYDRQMVNHQVHVYKWRYQLIANR